MPLRILVVDDNKDATDSLTLLLDRHGHDAWPAYGGRAALAAVERFAPDIALLDLAMPHMNGFEVLKALRLRADLYQPVAIAVTGCATSASEARARRDGFAHFLLKPVCPDELLRLLQSLDEMRKGDSLHRPTNPLRQVS